MCDTNPRIYAVSTKPLKRGVKHGVWVDITCTASEIDQAIRDMLDDCPDGGTTWEIHTAANMYGERMAGRYSPTTLAHMGEMISRFGRPWFVLAQHLDRYDLSEEWFVSAYCGEVGLQQFARWLIEIDELGILSEEAYPFFNLSNFVADLQRWTELLRLGRHLYWGVHSGWPMKMSLQERLKEQALLNGEAYHELGSRVPRP